MLRHVLKLVRTSWYQVLPKKVFQNVRAVIVVQIIQIFDNIVASRLQETQEHVAKCLNHSFTNVVSVINNDVEPDVFVCSFVCQQLAVQS